MNDERPQLSEPQHRVLTAIVVLYRRNQRAPSIREITDECGYDSTSTTFAHLQNLERLGYLRRGGPGEPRSLVVVSDECMLCGSSRPKEEQDASLQKAPARRR